VIERLLSKAFLSSAHVTPTGDENLINWRTINIPPLRGDRSHSFTIFDGRTYHVSGADRCQR
jgi:hypothetical protein